MSDSELNMEIDVLFLQNLKTRWPLYAIFLQWGGGEEGGHHHACGRPSMSSSYINGIQIV